jgi:hypothetical protein
VPEQLPDREWLKPDIRSSPARLQATDCEAHHGELFVTGGEINEDSITLLFLHHAYQEVDLVSVLNPNLQTYLTDEAGYRYPVRKITDIPTYNQTSEARRFAKIVRGQPWRYAVIFDAQGRKPQTLNFNTIFFQIDPDNRRLRRYVSCPGIAVLPR